MSDIPEDVMLAASKWTGQSYQPKTGTWFDVRNVIARAIMAERQRHQWQPISTAPKDGTVIDILTIGGAIDNDVWWIDDDGGSFWSSDYDDKFITHWRPLMPLPTDYSGCAS